MKKTYIKPEIEIIETETESLLNNSIVWNDEMGDGDGGEFGDEGSEIDAMSKMHNDVWGEW